MQTDSTEHINDILLLESIRTGIPSRLTVGTLPDLRHDLLRRIDEDLNVLAAGKAPRGRIIWGEYGQGKTHFLKTVEQHVLTKGFATSYFTLNRDVGLNDKRVLFPLLSNQTLTGENRIPGLLNQLTRGQLPETISDDLDKMESKLSHPFPVYMMRGFLSYRDAEDMLLFYNSLMGNPRYWTKAKTLCRLELGPVMKEMPKFTMRDHGHSFLEFYPQLLRILGWKGWVILIDEVELLGKMGKIGRLNSYLTLSWLLNWAHQHDLPIYTLVASARTLQTEVFYGRKDDMSLMPDAALVKYGDREAGVIRDFFKSAISGDWNLQLGPVGKQDFRSLFSALFDLHRRVFPWVKDADYGLIPRIEAIIGLENKQVRSVVRMFVELMDIFAGTGTLPDSIEEHQTGDYDLTGTAPDITSDGVGYVEKTLGDLFDE